MKKPVNLSVDDRQVLVDALHAHVVLQKREALTYANQDRAMAQQPPLRDFGALVEWASTLPTRHDRTPYVADVLALEQRCRELIRRLS